MSVAPHLSASLQSRNLCKCRVCLLNLFSSKIYRKKKKILLSVIKKQILSTCYDIGKHTHTLYILYTNLPVCQYAFFLKKTPIGYSAPEALELSCSCQQKHTPAHMMIRICRKFCYTSYHQVQKRCKRSSAKK